MPSEALESAARVVGVVVAGGVGRVGGDVRGTGADDGSGAPPGARDGSCAPAGGAASHGV
ncbi:hypothetical protein [Streptomyces sp. Ac-502]|uniref:hypothetical protein n=1 Tax=Streptomyces sp. Ac-502 TaxID=3342801 RepID=UPI0038627D00